VSKQINPGTLAKPESSQPAACWGLRTSEFYSTLRNKPIKITALDGKLYSGTLVGVDQYDLVIRQANGLTILFPKHAVKIVHADASDVPSAKGANE
jgi:hypothetical protein